MFYFVDDIAEDLDSRLFYLSFFVMCRIHEELFNLTDKSGRNESFELNGLIF